MRKELSTIEQIERYLLNEMDADERNKFEEELNHNPDLRIKTEEQKQVIEGLKRNYLKGQAKKAYRSYQLKNNFLKWGLISAIPLTALLLFYAYSGNEKNNNEITSSPYELPALNENGDSLWADPDKYLPYQFFTINNDQDTIIETEEGIVFAIPAHAFLDENGNPVNGNYQLEIKEAISTEAILSSGLETRSGDKDLETAGMFYINGRKNNSSLKINPANGIYAQIPTEKIRPEMQLFEGKRKVDGSIDWQEPKALETFLVPVDINSLNFYPPHYQDSLAAMGKNASNKKYTDSLYYSFDGKHNSSISPMPKTENINKTDSISYVYDKGVYNATYDVGIPFKGIIPAKVKAFWDPKFNSTILATKEFEERMQAIHQTCNNAVLDLYINNLDKKLCTIDSMAAQLLGESDGIFMQFARRGNGGVKTDESVCKKLSAYLQEKEKIYSAAAKKTNEDFIRKNKKLDEIALEKNIEQGKKEYDRITSNFKQELEMNLDEAYRQIGKKRQKTIIYFPKYYYRTQVNSSGWKNLDMYVIESTITRETLDYTDPETGKKAIIRYEEFSLSIADFEQYDAVFAYLIPDRLTSFMRMKGEKGRYSEKLNELLGYQSVYVAYKGKEIFMSDVVLVKPGNLGLISLKPSTKKESDKILSGIKGYNKESKIRDELSYQLFANTERLRAKNLSNRKEFIKRIEKVIFPCSIAMDSMGKRKRMKFLEAETPIQLNTGNMIQD